ncbi:helix-turn-helix transcriptional regulator [Enterococcus avium]|jgi:transcriptional regulator with XRE-family HTH domain|uniref:helix-turn-helix domain-containing protein n=1 Tax=Enterococcus avium TaxID=33945 RepID=UPI0032E4D180
MDKILEQIKVMVQREKLTQEYLAEKMNISRSYVSMILKGDRVLNKDLIMKFADALDLSVEELLSSITVEDEDFIIRTRGEFNSRLARNKMSKIKVQMDDYIRLKGIYENERIESR